MKKISLKEITDDILLIVRNNNISESEDLSRAQIHAWVHHYAHQLWKAEKDRRKALARQGNLTWEDLVDDEFIKQIESGPLELEDVESHSNIPVFTKRIKEPLKDVLDNNEKSILAVHDQQGEVIQYMNHIRRHYHNWRRYTYGDLTAYYDDGYVYVQGIVDGNDLRYIYVLWLQEEDVDKDPDDGNEDPDEDDVKYPAWLVPDIKALIMKNELSFMLGRPSDDSNNATLASVKPHGPQDEEE